MFNIFLSFLMILNSVAYAASPIIGGSDGPTFIAPLIMKEVTTPSNPAAGYQKLFINSVDGKMYLRTSAGVSVEVGSRDATKLQGRDVSSAAPNDADVLMWNASNSEWEPVAPSPGFLNPMTTAGDLIVGGVSGSPGRLGIGAANTVLTSSGSAASWAKILDANIDSAAAIVYSKLDLAGSIVNADINTSAGIVDTKLATISTSGKVSNSATTATSTNTNSAIVARDGSGNFSAGKVSALGFDAFKDSLMSAPSSGYSRLGVLSDGRPYFRNDNGAITDLEIGSGTVGDDEYIYNTDAKHGTDGWSLYQDSSATPANMTGGTTTGLTLARTTSSSEVVADTHSFKFSKDASNRQGGGFSVDITLNPQDYESQQPVEVRFKYRTTANLASGDLVCYAYDYDTPGTPMAITTGGEVANNGKITPSLKVSDFVGYFIPSSTTSSFYRIGCHIATTNATAYDLIYSKFHTRPYNPMPSTIITEWKTDTCTSTWTSNAVTTCKTRQVGDQMEIKFQVTMSGATTATQLIFYPPTGIVIDSSKMTAGASANSSFLGNFHDSSTGNNYLIDFDTVVSANGFYGGYQSSTAGLKSAFTNTAPVNAVASGDYVTVTVSFPVVGWSASNLLSPTQVLAQNPANAPTTATSSTKTPSGDHFHALTGNSITLPVGVWKLSISAAFAQTGGTPAYTYSQVGFYAANGTDTAAEPANLFTLTPNLTVLSACSGSCGEYGAQTSDFHQRAPQPITVRVTSPTTVYVVTRAQATTYSRARITAFINAERQADFNIFGMLGRTNWRVDANISGANPSLGTANVSTYTGIENGSLTLSNATSTNMNILTAQIPCSSTNAPSGTTCSAGSESVGVSFYVPDAQDVRACVSFGWASANSASSAIGTTFQIVQTANNAQTILQEGKGRVRGSNNTASASSEYPFQTCGTFSLSAGQNTLRLFYEQEVASTPSSSAITADAGATAGQRDIHWEVYPLGPLR